MATMTDDRGFKARAGSALSWIAIAGVAILIGTLLAFIMYRQGVGAEEREHQQTEIAALQAAVDEANERLAQAGETPVDVPEQQEPTYIEGPMGLQGPRGFPGLNGIDGEDGKDGAKGEKGDPGEDGADGLSGASGSTGATGEPGQAGEPGEPGPAGPAGPEGPQGPQGPQGPKGEKGDDGATGPPGLECPDNMPLTTILVQTAEEDAVTLGLGTWRKASLCLAPPS